MRASATQAHCAANFSIPVTKEDKDASHDISGLYRSFSLLMEMQQGDCCHAIPNPYAGRRACPVYTDVEALAK